MNDVSAALEGIQRTVWLGNSLQTWVVVLCILVLGVLLGRLARSLLRRYGTRLAQFTETDFDDAVIEAAIQPSARLLIVAACGAAVHVLVMPAKTHTLVMNGVIIAAGLVLIDLFAAWVDAFFRHGVREWRDKNQPHLDDAVISIGRKLFKAVFVIAGLLAILQTVGINVMSLLTGLGIGGLAVALAAQETLGNVLGSLQILTDRPFAAGDFVRVDGMFGRVLEIGLRSTKILTPDGIKLIVPNKKIAEAAVANCSAHQGVTEAFDIGLTYDTPAADVQRAAELIADVVHAQEHAHEEVTVHFISFGDFSLNLHVVYFHTDFGHVAMTRHAINLGIKRSFDEAGLSFAFPTQTLHLAGENPGDPLKVARS